MILPIQNGSVPDPQDTLAAPPHDAEAETCLLGAVLHGGPAAYDRAEGLQKEHFYVPANRETFGAMAALSGSQHPVDAVHVLDEMTRTRALERVGGRAFLTRLAEAVAGDANVEFYAARIRSKAMARALLYQGMEMTRRIRDGADPAEILLETRSALDRCEGQATSEIQPIGKVIEAAWKSLTTNEGHQHARTSYADLDRFCSFRPGSLTLIAGRPSMGKTALALNIALGMAQRGESVAFISIEMSIEDVVARLLSTVSGVDLLRIVNRNVIPTISEQEALDDAKAVIAKLPLYVEDPSEIGLEALRSRIRRLVRRVPDLRLTVVDYLGLITAPTSRTFNNRNDEVSAISRGLKALAKETKVPVLALSQLSRENAKANAGATDSAGVRAPSLSDLRDSGSLEQDADVVMFIHRPGYYHMTPGEDHKAQVIVKKNRNGPTGVAHLTWIGSCQRFNSSNGDPRGQP